MKKTLDGWIDDLRKKFNGRELIYQNVQKAKIQLQLKDLETGEIHLHNLEYTANDAQNLQMIDDKE